MAASFGYDNVGLGLSFQPFPYDQHEQQQLQQQQQQQRQQMQMQMHDQQQRQQQQHIQHQQQQHQASQTESQPQRQYHEQQRPVRPSLSIRSSGLPKLSMNAHQRTQSAVLPQRPFDCMGSSPVRSAEQIYWSPRSAHPMQRPFASPEHQNQDEYVHSAPVTPDSIRPPQRSLSYQIPQTEFARNGRSFRQAIDNRPPPSYMGSPRYSNGGHGEDRLSRAEGPNGMAPTSSSSSSYYYQTPQIDSTPFTESGQFPVPESHQLYGGQSNYNTPHLMSSPIFDHPYGRQAGYFDDCDDDMPKEPYVSTIKTNFPPMKTSTLRSNADENGHMVDSSDNVGFGSPPSSTSPDGTNKDKKTVYSRWTASEDLLLKDAITKHGDGKWSLVSACVPGRTPMQCSTRWQGALNTSIHKGRWDPDEDAILIKSVAEWQAWHVSEANKESATSGVRQDMEALEEELYKNIPWSNIASFLPRPRTGVQALARWSEALDPRITKGKWTQEEDVALMRGVQKYGKCWIKIANGVRGRTQRQCRTRYCQIVDKKRKSGASGIGAGVVPVPGKAGIGAAAAAAASITPLLSSIIPGSHAMHVPDLHFSD